MSLMLRNIGFNSQTSARFFSSKDKSENETKDEIHAKSKTNEKEKGDKKAQETKEKSEKDEKSFSSSSDEDVSIEEYTQLKKDYNEMALKTENFKKKFEEIRKSYLENKDEMESMRKRLEKENHQIKEFAITKFAKDLLDVCDNFDRALASMKDKQYDKLTSQEQVELYKQSVEGVKMTQEILQNTLKKHGVTEYNPLNEKFDPNKHDAVFNYEDEEKAPGTIGQVMNCGYLIGERVLRPAKVGIIKRK